MRAVTERPEAFELGLSKVIGTSREAIVGAVTRLLTDAQAYRSMTSDINPYGDGRAAERIAKAVRRWALGQRSPWLEPAEQFTGEATVLAG
jgi:UDP-N-acetylglucosamine 2-epimerase (non-hydrolysing)